MRAPFLKVGVFFGGLYLVLHLVLASSPVQGKVLSEIQKALLAFGVELKIESIEFSAFSPKIYLNRVSLQTNSSAPIQFPSPFNIDKLKIEFQPLALILGQIIISEAALYHPTLLLKDADELYKKVNQLLAEQKKWAVKGGSFKVVFKRIGIVDAVVFMSTRSPRLLLDSANLTCFVENSAKDQQTISLKATGLKFEREKLSLILKNVDIDLDITPRSARANRILVEGDDLMLSIKGASSIALTRKSGPESFHANYEIRIPLHILNSIAELKLPVLSGSLESIGTLENVAGKYLATGKANFRKLDVEKRQLGHGDFEFKADDKNVAISKLNLKIGQGWVTSQSVNLELQGKRNLKGDFDLNEIRLETLLASLGSPNVPLRMKLNGKLGLSGSVSSPLNMEGILRSQFEELIVINHNHLGIRPGNVVIQVARGELESKLQVLPDKVQFHSNIDILGGKAVGIGTIGYDGLSEIQVEAKGLSLTELAKIDTVEFGGLARLQCQIKVNEQGLLIRGGFEVAGAEIAGIVLGNVKGTAQYSDMLLSFDSMELRSLELIRGSGFVDFRPKKNHYKFQVGARRASVDQVFDFFRKQNLEFSKPSKGEVGARVIIEGGHDEKGIEIRAVGTGKGFRWYDESWTSAKFNLRYREDFIELSRAMLLKRSGALAVQGHFQGNQSKLYLQSFGLRLEDLDHIGKAPLGGELIGQLRLEGDLLHPRGNGEIRVAKTLFKGKEIGESRVSIKEVGKLTEFYGSFFSERLKARLTREEKKGQEFSDLLINFKNCDFTPLVALAFGKDLPPLISMKASGDILLNGVLNDWPSMKGSGTLSEIAMDLKNSNLQNTLPVAFSIDSGTLKVPRFELSGLATQVSGEFSVTHKGAVSGSLDGNLDLQYLQPFIPGLESGIGKVRAGLRLSGSSDKYELLGNLVLDEGTFKIQNLAEDFRNVKAQVSVTQDKLNVDRFEALHGGGKVKIYGDVPINRFTEFSPNLQIKASNIGFRHKNILALNLSGDFALKGKGVPYHFSGKCELLEGHLNSFNQAENNVEITEIPTLSFDIQCSGDDKLFVTTDVMDAEFKGNFRVLGNSDKLGLVGTAEGLRGALLFKETRFSLSNASVKFEDAGTILPRFNVAGRSFVKEQRATVPIEYEINLTVFGTSKDYKIRLNSVPALSEPDLIALLVLGVTTRGEEDNYLDFGTTIVGKTPLQTKLQKELGVDIKVNMQRNSGIANSTNSTPVSGADVSSVPAVKIQKDITKKTKLSYSNTLVESQIKELKIEQLLDENFTVNATAVDRIKGNTQNDSVKSYGLDFRYRFNFE